MVELVDTRELKSRGPGRVRAGSSRAPGTKINDLAPVRFSPDSAVKPKMPEARCNPGAAKASDCEISKSFCALPRRCYEARHPLEAPLIDVCSEANPSPL